jgi:hypothetical protein
MRDNRKAEYAGLDLRMRRRATISTRSYMNGDSKTPVNRDALLETFAAELTLAAYRVALQTRTRGTWLDLELDLWRALAGTVKTWERELSSSRERQI